MNENSSQSAGARLQEAIAAYLYAIASGKSPDRSRLLVIHPDLATELRAFFCPACQVARSMRDLHRDKRDVDRERSLQAAVEKSSQRMERFLAVDESSPSQRAQKNEWSVRVPAAVETVPDDQREALILHCYQGLSVRVVAERLKKTSAAVAGLLQRRLKNLRGLLADKE